MSGEEAEALGQSGVVGGEHAGVAKRAEVLGRIEAEATDCTERAGGLVIEARADGLGGVLDHVQAVALGDLTDGVHVGTLAEEMHRNDRPGERRDCVFDLLRVDVERPRIDINEHGLRAQPPDGAGRGEEREARHDDFVPFADVEGHQREEDGIAARSTGDGVLRAGECGDRFFELLHVRPEQEAAGVDDAGDGREDLLAERCVAAANIEQGNGGHGCGVRAGVDAGARDSGG